MNEQEMDTLAEQAKLNPTHLTHSKRMSTYLINGFIKVDVYGNWVTFIQYTDIVTGKQYARTADQFHNFS